MMNAAGYEKVAFIFIFQSCIHMTEAWRLHNIAEPWSDIHNMENAISFVRGILPSLTYLDLKECISLATGLKASKLQSRKTRTPKKSKRTKSRRSKKGGAIRRDDELMTEFLAIMDSIHDFSRDPRRAALDSRDEQEDMESMESLHDLLNVMGRQESFFD